MAVCQFQRFSWRVEFHPVRLSTVRHSALFRPTFADAMLLFLQCVFFLAFFLTPVFGSFELSVFRSSHRVGISELDATVSTFSVLTSPAAIPRSSSLMSSSSTFISWRSATPTCWLAPGSNSSFISASTFTSSRSPVLMSLWSISIFGDVVSPSLGLVIFSSLGLLIFSMICSVGSITFLGSIIVGHSVSEPISLLGGVGVHVFSLSVSEPPSLLGGVGGANVWSAGLAAGLVGEEQSKTNCVGSTSWPFHGCCQIGIGGRKLLILTMHCHHSN